VASVKNEINTLPRIGSQDRAINNIWLRDNEFSDIYPYKIYTLAKLYAVQMYINWSFSSTPEIT